MESNEVDILIDEDGTKYYVLKNSNILYSKKIVNYSNNLKELYSKMYYKGKLLHREDGPAIEWADGSKYWYKNGKLNKEDGPARTS